MRMDEKDDKYYNDQMVIKELKPMIMLVNSTHRDQLLGLKTFCEEIASYMKAKFFKFVQSTN